ncbi:MAG: branched-chain-amino-acid transaminase [Candidatus Thiodiazotropha sp.]
MTKPAYWLNGHCVDARDAVLPLNDHGLLYGDGIFEGIRFYQGVPFRQGQHLRRLEDSAQALMMTLPYSLERIAEAIDEIISEFAAPEGYLRLVVTRGPGGLGLDPTLCTRPSLFIIAEQMALVSEAKRRDGINLVTATTRRVDSTMLDPRIKSLNYLNNILARLEAHQAGADEALMLNPQGYVAEGSAENLFIVRDGALCTPPVSDGALDGITRGALMELARDSDLPMTERSLTRYDVYTADECFLTGTGAGLMPVRSLDGRTLKHTPGPYTRQLQQAYQRLIDWETSPGHPPAGLIPAREMQDV